jgi:hypothetical protein
MERGLQRHRPDLPGGHDTVPRRAGEFFWIRDAVIRGDRGGQRVGERHRAEPNRSHPAIDCAVTTGTASTTGCSATYLQGTSVTLTATPATDHTFSGWSGDCTGSTCVLTVSGNLAVTASFTAPPGPEVTVGRWDAAQSTAVVNLHVIQLMNGKQLMWGADGEPQLWNGPGSAFVEIPDNTCTNPTTCELFCAGHAFLADGRLLVAGGHDAALGSEYGINQASIFDGTSWQKTGYMTDARWYPTLVTLPNGDVLAISGTLAPGVYSTIPERYNGSTWTRLTGINAKIPTYPRAFVEPRAGNIFIADASGASAQPVRDRLLGLRSQVG